MIQMMIVMLAVGVPAYGQSAHYKTYVVDPPINNYAILQNAPLPATCKADSTMVLTACRGKYEPASFLIVTKDRLEDVIVTIGPLVGQTRQWLNELNPDTDLNTMRLEMARRIEALLKS